MRKSFCETFFADNLSACLRLIKKSWFPLDVLVNYLYLSVTPNLIPLYMQMPPAYAKNIKLQKLYPFNVEGILIIITIFSAQGAFLSKGFCMKENKNYSG